MRQFADSLLPGFYLAFVRQLLPQPGGQPVFAQAGAGAVEALEQGTWAEDVEVEGIEVFGVDELRTVIKGRRVIADGCQFLFVYLLLFLGIVLLAEQPIVAFHQCQERHEGHCGDGCQYRPALGTEYDEACHAGHEKQQAQQAGAVNGALQPGQCLGCLADAGLIPVGYVFECLHE